MVLLRQLSLLLFSLFVSTGIADTGNATQACQFLQSILPGRIFFPGSQGYESSIASYAYLGTRLRPICVAGPQVSVDVVTIIKTLSIFNNVAFAIRSGGHNTNKGFADIEHGITIDLSRMNSVQLDGSASVVSVGPGARWQKVYDALDPYQLSIQGGRNGIVGVGGFLLGGGIGFFSPERGWACDYVVNFEVVLSSGVIVNANSTSHADLFAALKGGQNNFGVVTSFQLRVFPQPPLWGGVIVYSNTTDKELIDALVAFKNPARFDPYAMFTFGFAYDVTHRAFTANIAMYHSRPSMVNGSALESFTNVQPQIYNSIRMGSPGSFAGEKFTPVVKQYYMHWATNTFVVSRTALTRIQNLFRDTSSTLTDEFPSANLTIAISIQSVPAAAPPSNPNIMGFAADSQPEKRLLNVGIAVQYEDPAATLGLDRATKILAAGVDQIALEEGVYDEHLYMNYAGSWQNVLGGYGQQSLRTMREVAARYDKYGMFQKQVIGGYKL